MKVIPLDCLITWTQVGIAAMIHFRIVTSKFTVHSCVSTPALRIWYNHSNINARTYKSHKRAVERSERCGHALVTKRAARAFTESEKKTNAGAP